MWTHSFVKSGNKNHFLIILISGLLISGLYCIIVLKITCNGIKSIPAWHPRQRWERRWKRGETKTRIPRPPTRMKSTQTKLLVRFSSVVFLSNLLTNYCEHIFIRWTFIFVFFDGRAIHEYKIPTKYLFTLVMLHIIWNLRIQVSMNMPIFVKPWNFVPMKLNAFTVVYSKKALGKIW